MSLRTLYDEASLWMTPGGYEDGKLFSELPTDGSGDFTFTRGSNLAATRVGPTGLIEKGRENLLLQSNQFDNASWGKYNVSVTTGQADKDGGTDAFKITKTGVNGRVYQSITQTGVNTTSVYAKAGDSTYLRFYAAGPNANVYFNLSDGTFHSGSSYIAYDIQSVGNGWYRCSITFSGGATIRIYPAEDNTTGGSSGSIYIQDAQAEQGLVATDYIETGASTAQAGILEDMPRLDYSSGASCPALLLEPQRTNLIMQSEYMGEWAQSTGDVTLSDNLSPEGVKNCYRLEGTASGLRIGIATFAAVIGNTYTGSIWVRKVSGSDTAQIVDVDFNQTQINITTEWQRFSITRTATSTTGRLYVYVEQIGDVIEVYGAQLESGSYPTSYIPTYGASVTRSGDITDRGANLSYTGNYTLFMEFNLTEDAAYILNATTLSAWSMYVEGSFAGFRFGRTGGDAGGVSFASSFDWSAAIGTNVKIALVKNGTSVAMFVNGTKYTPSANTLSTGNEVLDWRYLNYTTTTTRHKQNYINQLLEFEEALTDSECIALTKL